MEKIEKIIFAGKRAICREPMAAAILQREHLNFPVEILARGIVVLFPEPLNQKAEAVTTKIIYLYSMIICPVSWNRLILGNIHWF